MIEDIIDINSTIIFTAGRTCTTSSNPNVIVVNIEYVLQRHLQKASECILFIVFRLLILLFVLFLIMKCYAKSRNNSLIVTKISNNENYISK